MANKVIVWKLKIGGLWVDVSEKTFVLSMRTMNCDHVNLKGGKTRFAIFYNKNGYPIGKVYMEEV